MTDFTLRNVPLLSRIGADRADVLRTDVDAVRRARLALDHLEATGRGRIDRMGDLLSGSTDEQTRTEERER